MLRLDAPAKLNLFLRVHPPRPDGFHPLDSWFRTVALFDLLELEKAATWSFDCSLPGLAGEGNLVVRAHAALESHVGRVLGARVRLQKRIPIGAGLGGGSSDAAAAIVGLEKLLRLGLAIDELARIGAQVGSDVPFFVHALAGGTQDARCTGRGEVVAPFHPEARHAVLLLTPPLEVSTAAVYRRLDELRAEREASPGRGVPAEAPDFAALSRLPLGRLLETLHNDLTAPAFDLHPELAILAGRAAAELGRPVHLTGSGSTLFTLYETTAEASRAAAGLEGRLAARALALPANAP